MPALRTSNRLTHMMRKTVFLSLLFSMLGLVSCSRQIKVSPSDFNLVDLTNQTSFQFNGKMSFSDGEEGGSGQVDWQQQSDQLTVRLRAPLGSKSWTLIETQNQAKLSDSNQTTVYAPDSATLIADQVGWLVPWEPLKSWVIGQATGNTQIAFNSENMSYQISEQGWDIKYERMKPYAGGYLPHKITARKQNYAIKLIIKQWQW